MIKGKKIYLNAIDKENIKQLMNWRNDENLRQYFREYRELNYTMQEEWYNKIIHDPTQVNFEIHNIKTNELIGCCGLLYIDWRNRKAEFSIYLGDDKYRNKGYGIDTFRTLIKYGFEELNLNKIWGEVYSNNDALNIYLHVGFIKEGELKETVYKNGKYLNSTMIRMLKSEYEELKKGELI